MRTTEVKEVQIDPITITYVTEDGKKHIDVITMAYQLVKEGKRIKKQPTDYLIALKM